MITSQTLLDCWQWQHLTNGLCEHKGQLKQRIGRDQVAQKKHNFKLKKNNNK